MMINNRLRLKELAKASVDTATVPQKSSVPSLLFEMGHGTFVDMYTTAATLAQAPVLRFWFIVLLIGAVSGILAACQLAWLPSADAQADAQLRMLIARRGLSGDPSTGRDIPRIDDPLAQLGMKLFFTKALGGDEDSACASCHLPTLGGGDDLSLPIGVGALDPDRIGPGRVHPSGGPTVPRNSPTTFNVALWDSVLFHDGRVESLGKTVGANGTDGLGIRTPDSALGAADPLAGDNLVMAQARFPVTSKQEMLGFGLVAATNQEVRDELASRLEQSYLPTGKLADSNPWRREFEAVFGAPAAGAAASEDTLITEQRIAQAIGEYERSQLFVNTPWKAYVAGDNGAISQAAKQGARLFFQSAEEGGANCVSCHTGDFMTDEQFHVLAVPQLGPGKGDGNLGMHDYGRFRETGNPDDLYAFRTPSLLNVAVTGPYGHDGAYRKLEGMVRHILNPTQAVENYDFRQLDAGIQTEHCVEFTQEALAKLQENRQNGLPSIAPVVLTDAEIGALVEFLQTLTDPCTQDPACLSPWMPDVRDADLAVFQLIKVSEVGGED